MKVAFSLSKSKPSAPAPSLKRPAAFASVDDDEPLDAAPTASSLDKNVAPNKQLLAQNVGSSKTMKKRMEAEMKVDATVYEYDEVWDRIQEVKQRQKEAKEVDAKERKVCSRHLNQHYSTNCISPQAQVHTRSLDLGCYSEARPSTCRGENDAVRARSRRR